MSEGIGASSVSYLPDIAMPPNYSLAMFGLPLINDLKTLADEISLSPGLLYKLSVVNEKFYYSFDLPKKSGGSRKIHAPSRSMKAVQSWILRNILDKIQLHQAATGFRLKRSVRDNAVPHMSNTYLLCMDIDDFFPSISYAKVYTVFRGIGYNAHVAHIFSGLCTCEGRLPQGGVTSPALSNIVCIRLDRRLSSFVGRRNITYTRYADDMTFSCKSPQILSSIMPTIQHILKDEGFKLNTKKTRRMGPARQRRITGLVLSNSSVGVGKKRKQNLRASIYNLLSGKVGNDERLLQEARLRGWFAYLHSVDQVGIDQLRLYTAKLAARLGVPNVLAE